MRWAALALLLFLSGWTAQALGAPTAVSWGLYLACYAAGGWEPALAGLRALRERTLDVDILMIVAAIAAASIGQVFDGALLIVIFATSGALEAVVTQRTADAVSSLLDLAPERAALIDEGGGIREVESASLVPGQTILIRPGERIAGDGVVVTGASEVDQQAVTGESVPVVRGVGDDVLSGTVNGTGALTVEITRPASDSVVARIARMVAEASETKARTQLFVETVEQRYSMGVVIATLLVFAVPMLAFGEAFDAALLRAITFMIVASPCAVVLSTMPPLLASMANAGRRGVLVKTATAMEGLGRTTLVAFDKTGTLTEGAPDVVSIEAADGDADGLLRLAAAVERMSEHPLGRAIVRAAETRGMPVPAVAGFRALPGRGVVGVVEGREIEVVRADDADAAGTLVEVRVSGAVAGVITLADAVRPAAAAAVAAVRDATARPPMLLTGDGTAAAMNVAAATGVVDVRSALLPDDKARIVQDLAARGERVMLVGDGVNDAPALAAASTGVAMGRRGSDLAIESADVVIVRDELDTIPQLLRLSRRAHRYVVANLAIAAAFIAVLVVWDLVGTLPLALAVAGHEGSTVVVALNGLRLLSRRAWER
ncbi:cobalt-translocating P-type ATPase CtpD [Microbacterium gilvum]|uniref:Cobalt-translocating P-type ATPase CtpD n=1 Tax=Microbacterium gilvum TaxID=1336204 RepID=A0ABP9AHX0_9MICO